MNSMYQYCADIRLHVKGRISEEDAARQDRTARDILKRLSKQPGLILADEVGMGKTFVALAVAVSVALENRGKRPVVVMVPSSFCGTFRSARMKTRWPWAAPLAHKSEKRMTFMVGCNGNLSVILRAATDGN